MTGLEMIDSLERLVYLCIFVIFFPVIHNILIICINQLLLWYNVL